MKILVTGGAGFIGSHVVDEYINAGHQVIVVDNLSTGNIKNINPKAKFINIDIQSQKLKQVFANEKPDIVNHHAAQISVPASLQNPINDAQCNVIGLINILQCCRIYKVTKIIFISSGGAIYGNIQQGLAHQTSPKNPMSMYAMNKLVGQQYVQMYNRIYGLNYVILRYSNVYGPRQYAGGQAGVIAIFINKLLNNDPITINLIDKQSDMFRDYVYVKDVAAVNRIALLVNNKTYNVSTGIPTSTTKIYALVSQQLNIIKPANIEDARPGDIFRSVLSYDRINMDLGWVPKYSIYLGIKQTVKYFSNVTT